MIIIVTMGSESPPPPPPSSSPTGRRTVLSIDPGTRHCAVCVLDVGDDCFGRDDRLIVWYVTDIGGSTVPQVLTAMRGVLGCLAAGGGGSLPSIVVLEKQVGSNHTMCRIEHAIHAFFVTMGIEVVLVDPKRKYAYLEKSGLYTGGFPSGRVGDKLSPFHRKRITALAIEEWIKSSKAPDLEGSLLEFYRSNKKRDDLADAVLQALEHCHWDALVLYEREHAPPLEPIEPIPLRADQLRKKRWSPGNIVHLLRDHGNSFEDMMTEIRHQGRAMRREIVGWCGFQPNEPNYEHVFRVLRASIDAFPPPPRPPTPPPPPPPPTPES